MAIINTYLGIERISVTDAQWQAFIGYIESLGVANVDGQPQDRNHWRFDVAGNAAIFQALFDDTTISRARLKQEIADVVGVSAGNVNEQITAVSYSGAPRQTTQVVYRRAGTNYVRVYVFGDNVSLTDSHREVLSYLDANAAQWGIELPPPDS